MLPDIDLLFGGHRALTHGVGTALVVGLAVGIAAGRGRLGLAAGAAYGSHILLDWLGADTSPPIGVMALWPFSLDYYQSDIPVFAAVSRRYWISGFIAHNLRAVAWELVILLPLVLLVFIFQRQPPVLNTKKEKGRRGEGEKG
jgi:inner membrane protein